MRLTGFFPHFCSQVLVYSQPLQLAPLLKGLLCAQGTRVDSWILWEKDRRNANTSPWGAGFAGDMRQSAQQILYKQSTNLSPSPLHSTWEFSFLCTVASLPWSWHLATFPRVPGFLCTLPWKWVPGSPERHIPATFTGTSEAPKMRAHAHTHTHTHTHTH